MQKVTVEITAKGFIGLNAENIEKALDHYFSVPSLNVSFAVTEAARLPEDTDLVTIPRAMVLGLEQTIKSLKAELDQCKHALDDDNE